MLKVYPIPGVDFFYLSPSKPVIALLKFDKISPVIYYTAYCIHYAVCNPLFDVGLKSQGFK